MNTEHYLDRIGIAVITGKPDLELLAQLQCNHLLSVPFENLDIVHGHPIVLDVERLYHKVVEQYRGGFCYELNGLFYQLLVELGYHVDMVSACVRNKETGVFGPEFDHMALVVHFEDGDYLVDVGYASSTRRPIKLPDGAFENEWGTYQLVGGDEEGRFMLQSCRDGEWWTEYSFTTIPRNLREYGDMCGYHQSSPESFFSRGSIVTRSTPDGWVLLKRECLTVVEMGIRTRFAVESEEAYSRLLDSRFGIRLDQHPDSVHI